MRIYTKGAWKQEDIKNKRKEEKKKARKQQRKDWNRASGPLGRQFVLYAMRIYTKGAWRQEEIRKERKRKILVDTFIRFYTML